MAVDTLFNDVRLLLQSGSLTNAATSSPATVSSAGVTPGAALTFSSSGVITASGVALANPALATVEMVVTPTWEPYSKIASMLGVSLNAVSAGVIGIYFVEQDIATLAGSLTTAQSGEITLIAEYILSGAGTEIKLTAIPLSGSTTTVTVSASTPAGSLPATLILGGPPAIPVPVPGGSATVARVQAPRASYSQQQIASLRNTNPSNSIIYSSTPVSVTATAVGVSHTYTVSNPENRTVDDVLSELSLGISQLTGAVLMAETGYFTGAEQRASLRLTFTPISSDVDNWEYSFVGMPNATAIYFATGVYGANPPLSQISTATYTFTPGAQNAVSLTAFGATTTGLTTDMPAFVAAVASAHSTRATVSGVYPFAGQCIVYVTGAVGVEFTLTASIAASATVPSGIATLRGARVTAKRRYIDLGAAVEYPTLPWPTTSIPGGGVGGQLPTDVWLALGFESGIATDLSTYAHTKLTQDQVTLQTTGSRTNNGYAVTTGTAAALNYDADLNELNGLSEITVEFDVYVPESGAGGAYFFGAAGSDCWYLETAVGVATITPTGVWGNLFYCPIVVPTNSWHHVAWSGGVNTGAGSYLDGVLQQSMAGITAIDFNSVVVAGYNFSPLGVAERPDLATLPGLRMDNVLITKRRKYTANFTPPGPITGGGTGWGTLPADVIFAVPAESNGNDVAQFGLSATASGTATIQASGSRTGDGYLRNTDGAQGADACFGYTPSAGFKSAWGAAQSMTLEFDIRVDTGAFLGGQILGIGSGYTALSGGGSTGSFLGGSPFATSAGSAELTVGAWHHIAFVADYNAGDRLIRTYRDGVQQGPAESVASFGFADYPNPTTIGLLQLYAGFIGNGALKGGMDNIILTTRAKYSADFTPGTTFAEIVGYTPPPSGVDVSLAGYHDLDNITGTGTFNTQLTPPDAYFFSVATLDDAVSTGDAYTLDGNSINFTGSRTLGATTCTGTFVSGTPQNFDSDVTLDDATAESTFFADTPKEWSGDSTLGDATQFGLMMFLAPASFSGDATAEGTYSDGVADVITPPTMRVSTTLPALRLTASGAPRAFSGVLTTLPELTATARGGHYSVLTLPTITATATGTTIAMARAIMTIPMVEVEATGRVAGQSSAQFRLPRIEATSFGGHQAELTLPEITASAAGTTGNAAQASFSLPRVTATAQGHRDDTARAAITLPAIVPTPSAVVEITLPAFTVLAHGQPVLTGAYEAYVLNMNQPLDDNPRNNFEAKVEQVTRYTNWPFIQVVRLGDAYYGVAEDGLYELGGATDNGTEIAWAFETCKTDFDDPHKKAVASAYIGGQTGPDLTYTLRSGDDVDRMYEYVTTKVVQKRNHRQKFGLGRRVRYYSFGLAGRGEAAIDTLEFELLSTTRRI